MPCSAISGSAVSAHALSVLRLSAALSIFVAAFAPPLAAQTLIYTETAAPVKPQPPQGSVSVPAAIPASVSATGAPKLIVAIAIDQLSADLFAEYRGQFTGGFKRLQQGAVFPAGFQAQSATETCPGHSTILTGNYPARSGIIANDWVDLSAKRDDKEVYCAEDETAPGSTSKKYTVSDTHLLVPTLGERMKAANPKSRVFSVAGKDRAAVMMGGKNVDEIWWWDVNKFTSYAGRTPPAAVTKANRIVAQVIANDAGPISPPDFCAAHSRAVSIGGGGNVGAGRFARKGGNPRSFRASPELDQATIGLAGDLIHGHGLGKGPATDIIAIGASATDIIGHTYGTSGSEMCINLVALDKSLGQLFELLDRERTDYLVVLTADHGGHDLPERLRQQSIPNAARIDASVSPEAIGGAIAKKLKLKVQPLHSRGLGDIWIDRTISASARKKVLASAVAAYRAHPLVAAVFTHAELARTPISKNPPETWSLIERARASFYAPRSGDLYVALKPYVTPIPDPSGGYVATHGSIWDYDRRVPILFWRQGMARFEQPLSIPTVDIAPTLAGILKLRVESGAFDGQCRDLDAGEASTCS